MIECKYGNQKRLFINHLGELIPCCYVNAEALSMGAGNHGKTLFGELNEKYDNSLYNNSIQEILDGSLFNGIINSWNTDAPVEKCKKTCEKKERDIFEDKFNAKSTK
tara:strand:+ start:668 stop:988 length:321 start_codon:yes stop_codon:yes gene_type:complete